jgi:HPt (histidine-containing phosphotransfer) domain-containing protein
MPDYNNDLDLTFLYEIADGSNEFIVESISMFIDQSPDIMRELGNAIAAGNWPQAALEAHKIKANLGFFGMLNSQALIQQIEGACKDGSATNANMTSKYNEVKSLITANLVTLKQIKTEKENGI